MSTFATANVYGEVREEVELPYIKKEGDTATGLIIFDGGLETNVGTATFNGPIIATDQITFTPAAELYCNCPSEFADDVTVTGGSFVVDVPATFNSTVIYNDSIQFNDAIVVTNTVQLTQTSSLSVEGTATFTGTSDLQIDGAFEVSTTPLFTAGANFQAVAGGSITTITQDEIHLTDLVGLNTPYTDINKSGLITSFTSTDDSPQLILINKNLNGGASSVVMQTYKDKDGNGGEAGDDIFRLGMTGQTADSTQVDYCSITSSILDPDDVSFQGVLTLSAAKGGTLQNFLSMDGQSNTVTLFKNLKFGDGTTQTTAFTGSVIPVITNYSGAITFPPWTFANATSHKYQLSSSLGIGLYTVTWQGQLNNLQNATFAGLSTGILSGPSGAASPIKYPNIQLLKVTNTGPNDNFIYFGGSITYYNPIVQAVAIYIDVSNGYVVGTTPSVANVYSASIIKLS